MLLSPLSQNSLGFTHNNYDKFHLLDLKLLDLLGFNLVIVGRNEDCFAICLLVVLCEFCLRNLLKCLIQQVVIAVVNLVRYTSCLVRDN